MWNSTSIYDIVLYANTGQTYLAIQGTLHLKSQNNRRGDASGSRMGNMLGIPRGEWIYFQGRDIIGGGILAES